MCAAIAEGGGALAQRDGEQHSDRDHHKSGDEHRHQARARSRVRRHPGKLGFAHAAVRHDTLLRWFARLEHALAFAAQPFALVQQDAAAAGNSELQAFRDPLRALDEVVSRRRRADFARGRFEQRQPAIEMLSVDG